MKGDMMKAITKAKFRRALDSIKRKSRFLVGYPGKQEHIVWGRDNFNGDDDHTDACRLMTRRQAEKAIKQMCSDGAVVFELVPVK